jgi:uncharacterized protein (TIGR02996 family)
VSQSLYNHPLVLSLLRQAKETPEDDTPRLVLADFLEEHDDPDRAEFIRLGCTRARGAAAKASRVRREELLAENGGAWLCSLWESHRWPTSWHRGLLTASLPRRLDLGCVLSVLPWTDAVIVPVPSRASLLRLAELLTAAEVNHLHLDLRPPLREASLLDLLTALPESPFLRSLTIDWPLTLTRHEVGESASPAISPSFFGRLVAGLPVGRHLTVLASWPALSDEQAAPVRRHGVEAVAGDNVLWMHGTDPASFSARR